MTVPCHRCDRGALGLPEMGARSLLTLTAERLEREREQHRKANAETEALSFVRMA